MTNLWTLLHTLHTLHTPYQCTRCIPCIHWTHWIHWIQCTHCIYHTYCTYTTHNSMNLWYTQYNTNSRQSTTIILLHKYIQTSLAASLSSSGSGKWKYSHHPILSEKYNIIRDQTKTVFDSLISSLFINSVLALHGPKSKVSEEQKEIRTIWRAKAHLECGRECSRLVKTNWAQDKEPSLIKPWVRNGHLKCKDPRKEGKKHRKFPIQKETAGPMYKCPKTISWQKTPYILC